MQFKYAHTQAACYISALIQAIVINLPPLLFVTFQQNFHLSLEAISLLISISFGVQMLVDFLFAKWTDHLNHRACIVASNVLEFSGLILYGVLPYLLPPYAGMVLATIVCAVGSGLVEVLVSPISEALPGKHKAARMSLLHSMYCWGDKWLSFFCRLFILSLWADPIGRGCSSFGR